MNERLSLFEVICKFFRNRSSRYRQIKPLWHTTWRRINSLLANFRINFCSCNIYMLCTCRNFNQETLKFEPNSKSSILLTVLNFCHTLLVDFRCSNKQRTIISVTLFSLTIRLYVLRCIYQCLCLFIIDNRPLKWKNIIFRHVEVYRSCVFINF